MSDDPSKGEPHRRYAEAVVYAIRKHANQLRRDGSAYISHPIRVAESLRTIGGVSDIDVIIAALLHDVIEDTECEWASIEMRFGERVADLVAVMTGDMRLPRPQRRQGIIDQIRAAGDDAKSIRLADRLDNLTDMKGFTPEKREEYIEGSARILEACRGANAGLEKALENAIAARS